MNIFISNLPADSKLIQQLRNLFSEFGIVKHAMIVQKSKTIMQPMFGWVIMTDETDSLNAIKGLDHSKFMQQIILVNQATLVARYPNCNHAHESNDPATSNAIT